MLPRLKNKSLPISFSLSLVVLSLSVLFYAQLVQADQGDSSMSNETRYVQVEVSYLQRIALPAEAEISVSLQDIARMDAPAQVLSTVKRRADGAQVPFRFEIPYQPEQIEGRGRYVVRAEIRLGDRLLFTTDTITPVINNQVESVSLRLITVGN